MRNYLIFSSSAHFLLLAVFFFFARASFPMKKQQNYYIDFIGQGKVVTMETANAAQGAESRRAAEPVRTAKSRPASPKDDSFSSSGEAADPLPKPSVLGGTARLIEPQPEEKGGGEGGNGSPVVADFSNFPYPWYITQVREALWNSWTQRMPSSGMLKCTVRFEIQRGGTVSAVAVERSSGNRLFDYAAETAVESSAPFPVLPDDFYEDALTVHVEFKTTD
jgi:protein TonB